MLSRGCGRGVTLIELVVVLAIIGIAIAIAGPSFFKSVDRFTLDSTGRQLVTAFRGARNEARLGRQELLGTFSSGKFVLFKRDQRIRALDLPSSIEVEAAATDGAQYTFLASGNILGPARLVVSASKYRGALILGPPPGTVRFQAEP